VTAEEASGRPTRPLDAAALFIAALVWPVTYVVFHGFAQLLPPAYAYLAGSLFYWALLAGLSGVLFGRRGLVAIFRRPPHDSIADKVATAVGFSLALPPLFVVFLPNAPGLLGAGWLVLVFSALCNGTLEEVFWRGVFVERYSDDIWRAYVLPTLFFVLWHITLATMPGMHFQGGWPALIGGAAGFGVVWGYVAWRQRSIRVTATAHVLVNFFAFSGLIQDNWPG
jgi:membrane protease YdiL (CAAX protease family)